MSRITHSDIHVSPIVGATPARTRRVRSMVFCLALTISSLLLWPVAVLAQSTGNAGSITGTVTDPTGAVVPGATVEIMTR